MLTDNANFRTNNVNNCGFSTDEVRNYIIIRENLEEISDFAMV